VAFAGKNGEKLPEQWVACYRARVGGCTPWNNIVWVEDLKKNGYQINGSTCGPYGGGRIISGPIISPTLQWAVPNSCLNGPPPGPYGPYGTYPNK